MPHPKRPSDHFNKLLPPVVAEFFTAVMNNNLSSLQHLLAEHPDAPQWRDRAGNTPLMISVIFGSTHKEITDFLIQHGADVNAKNTHGGNALARAAHFGHKDLVEQLLALGADVHMKDAADQDAVEWANKNGQTEIATLLLHRQKTPVCKYLPPQP